MVVGCIRILIEGNPDESWFEILHVGYQESMHKSDYFKEE